MLILNHLWIIMALPLLGAAINGLLGKNWPKSLINSIAVGSVSLSFLCVLELIREFAQLPADQIPWIGRLFHLDHRRQRSASTSRLQVDQLTIVMLLVVTFVSSLVHIYSTGYMAHEGGYYRFFSYLNLFVFFMLTLVLGANLHRHVRRMGRRGLVQLPAHRLLVPEAVRHRRREKSFHHHAPRRFAFTVGILLAFWTFGSLNFQRHVQDRLADVLGNHGPCGRAHHHRHPAVHRRHR